MVSIRLAQALALFFFSTSILAVPVATPPLVPHLDSNRHDQGTAHSYSAGPLPHIPSHQLAQAAKDTLDQARYQSNKEHLKAPATGAALNLPHHQGAFVASSIKGGYVDHSDATQHVAPNGCQNRNGGKCSKMNAIAHAKAAGYHVAGGTIASYGETIVNDPHTGRPKKVMTTKPPCKGCAADLALHGVTSVTKRDKIVAEEFDA